MSSSSNANRIRKADHAGSWYSDDGNALRRELQGYWDAGATKLVSSSDSGQLPVKHARVIISPHAGFRYSGPTAGVAFRALDMNKSVQNVFVVGPSHHLYLENAAVSTCNELETPLGNLKVNRDICNKLLQNPIFTTVRKSDEEAEHSLEMQYPWVRFAMEKAFVGVPEKDWPAVVPIMAGNTSESMEKALGQVLAPYLQESNSLFVVSSDFAHWGKRFRYTYYLPQSASDPDHGIKLRNDSQVRPGFAIHESIAKVDDLCMHAIKTGTYELFRRIIEQTGNTVCGRHPIGIIMCALNALHKSFVVSENLSGFVFTDYSRSGLVNDVEDSSVSYASAYAKVESMDDLHFVDILSKVQEVIEDSSDDSTNSSSLQARTTGLAKTSELSIVTASNFIALGRPVDQLSSSAPYTASRPSGIIWIKLPRP